MCPIFGGSTVNTLSHSVLREEPITSREPLEALVEVYCFLIFLKTNNIIAWQYNIYYVASSSPVIIINMSVCRTLCLIVWVLSVHVLPRVVFCLVRFVLGIVEWFVVHLH